MKLYIYRNVITFDEQEMDEHIFNELSSYTNGAPSDERVASEWEHVEVGECDLEGLISLVKKGHRLLEHISKGGIE